MAKVILSQKQARTFARMIYADIRKFCEEHREEFEAFLQEEQNGGAKNELSEDRQRDVPAVI